MKFLALFAFVAVCHATSFYPLGGSTYGANTYLRNLFSRYAGVGYQTYSQNYPGVEYPVGQNYYNTPQVYQQYQQYPYGISNIFALLGRYQGQYNQQYSQQYPFYARYQGLINQQYQQYPYGQQYEQYPYGQQYVSEEQYPYGQQYVSGQQQIAYPYGQQYYPYGQQYQYGQGYFYPYSQSYYYRQSSPLNFLQNYLQNYQQGQQYQTPFVQQTGTYGQYYVPRYFQTAQQQVQQVQQEQQQPQQQVTPETVA